jgi:DNA mismatch repair protein MutS
MPTTKLTPMMRQYLAFKDQYKDAVLFFRMGDFYEMFFDDAKLCARVLGLALTSRDKGENPIPMAGFPHHAADNYIKRLVQAGHRVAICDQVQDPKEAKGLVKRDVTRVVTAGTLTEENILDSASNNFLAAVVVSGSLAGLAWVDVSTGRFEVEEVPLPALGDSLQRIAPAECLLADTSDDAEHPALDALPPGCMVTRRPPWDFAVDDGHRRLLDHFGVRTLEGFGCEQMRPALGAAGAALTYLLETQKSAVGHLRKLEAFAGDRYLVLDATTRRALELVETMRGADSEGALLKVLDRTCTPMGARMLRRWVLTPLRRREEIEQRHDAVGELHADRALCRDLAAELRSVYDIERLTTKIHCGRANARDLAALRNSLSHVTPLGERLSDVSATLLQVLADALDPVPEAEALIAAAIRPDPPTGLTDGGIIKDGFSPDLDELRLVAREGKNWIARFEAREAKESGIPKLKVGFNKVFGYYIEVSNLHHDKVPEHYIRKQTLKNAERYITPELKERESAVLTSAERAKEMEYDVFQNVRERVAAHTDRLQATAEALAMLDVLLSLGVVAAESRYVRPTMSTERVLHVRDGRHPVLEQMLADEFVPNDIEMTPDEARLLVITGPNMAGKSVYIRQTALIVLMAHMGSFVPATSAVIGLTDRIFTRVGASDEQHRGQSTFMVEMVEVANILNNASDASLIILDEVGRGTSTFDGVSLAWAVAEHIHDLTHARTLFATHYHELAQLAATRTGVVNLNVAIREWKSEVVFLHRVVPGATDRSYGIHVAKLAGVPGSVLTRADEILGHLESNAISPGDQPTFAPPADAGPQPRMVQMPLFMPLDTEIRDELLALDTSAMTPLEALTALNNITERLRDGKD